MQVRGVTTDLEAEATPMRAFVARPRDAGLYPGLVLFTDIFALTDASRRAAIRFASHGFVVYVPEFYHRIQPPGTFHDFETARAQALADAARTTVEQFDRDTGATLRAMANDTGIRAGAYGAAGFCIGGHLAFRAALDPRVRATVCFYPTGLHDGTLGASTAVDTLDRASSIAGRLMLVLGDTDAHVPPDARALIFERLARAKPATQISVMPGDHAFMRDVGERYDAQSADRAFTSAIDVLNDGLR